MILVAHCDATGKQIWKHSVKDFEFVSLTVGANTVYVAAYKTGNVYALATANGNKRWVHKLRSSIRSLAVDGATIFAGANRVTLLRRRMVTSFGTRRSMTAQPSQPVPATYTSAPWDPNTAACTSSTKPPVNPVWSFLTAQSPI